MCESPINNFVTNNSVNEDMENTVPYSTSEVTIKRRRLIIGCGDTNIDFSF